MNEWNIIPQTHRHHRQRHRYTSTYHHFAPLTHMHTCSWCGAGKRVSVDIMCTVSRLPVLADVAVSWSGTITRSTITGSTIVTRAAAAAAAVHVQLGGGPGGSQRAGKAEARRGFMIDRSRAASWNHSLIFSFHHHVIAHKCGTVSWDQ